MKFLSVQTCQWWFGQFQLRNHSLKDYPRFRQPSSNNIVLLLREILSNLHEKAVKYKSYFNHEMPLWTQKLNLVSVYHWKVDLQLSLSCVIPSPVLTSGFSLLMTNENNHGYYPLKNKYQFLNQNYNPQNLCSLFGGIWMVSSIVKC